MWPSPPCLSLSLSSAVSPAAMVVVFAQSAVVRVREKTNLARGVHDVGPRVVGVRREVRGNALVGGAAHAVRTCAG
jgi:hypothetical protein